MVKPSRYALCIIESQSLRGGVPKDFWAKVVKRASREKRPCSLEATTTPDNDSPPNNLKVNCSPLLSTCRTNLNIFSAQLWSVLSQQIFQHHN